MPERIEDRLNGRATSSWPRWLGIAALVLVSGLFSFLNAGERVTLNAGFTVIYRISLVGLVFVVFLLGMLTMFLFGLRQDRRIREALRIREARRQPDSYPPQPMEPPV